MMAYWKYCGRLSSICWMSHGRRTNARRNPLRISRKSTLKRCATGTRPFTMKSTTKEIIRLANRVIGLSMSGWSWSKSLPHAVIFWPPRLTRLQLKPMRITSPNAISTTYATGIENDPQTENGMTRLTSSRRLISTSVSIAAFHGTCQLQMYPTFLRIWSK